MTAYKIFYGIEDLKTGNRAKSTGGKHLTPLAFAPMPNDKPYIYEENNEKQTEEGDDDDYQPNGKIFKFHDKYLYRNFTVWHLPKSS